MTNQEFGLSRRRTRMNTNSESNPPIPDSDSSADYADYTDSRNRLPQSAQRSTETLRIRSEPPRRQERQEEGRIRSSDLAADYADSTDSGFGRNHG